MSFFYVLLSGRLIRCDPAEKDQWKNVSFYSNTIVCMGIAKLAFMRYDNDM